MNVKALQRRLRDFAVARDWPPFHSPKNLAMALMVESAELLELFQWLTTAQSHTLTRNPVDKERVEDEIADVLLYLLQLADHTDVDIEKAVESKLLKNATKHPAKHPEKPLPEPKAHLLVDWENVHPKGGELRALVRGGTDVWLFHSPGQKVDASSHREVFGSDRVTLIPRSGSGKNALDFQLSYYIGYITANYPEGRFTIISNDKGYDPMLAHARELGFDAQRCEFHKRPAAPVSNSVKSKHVPTSSRRGPNLPVATKKAAAPAAPIPAGPSAAQIAWRAICRLRMRSAEDGSIHAEDLPRFVAALIHEAVPDKDLLAQRACRLLQERKLGLARAPLESERATVATTAASVSMTPFAPVTVVRPVDHACQVTSAKKAVASPSPPVQHAAKKNLSVSASKTPAQPARNMVDGAASKPFTPVQTPAQVAQHVLASLKKMPDNKPTRHAGLLKFIETHASKAVDPKAAAIAVYNLLETGKHVALSADGKRVSYPKLGSKKAASA